jgi:hypothetical protein
MSGICPLPIRGVGEDPAVRRLPEHFREAQGRDSAALDQVMKHGARSNGWKLVYVADQNESGAVRNRPNKGVCIRGTRKAEVASSLPFISCFLAHFLFGK